MNEANDPMTDLPSDLPGDAGAQAKSQEELETGTFNAAKDGLAVANQLVRVVRDIQRKMAQINKDNKRSRKIMWGLGVSIFLDVTLSVVTVLLAIGLNSTSTNQRVATQQTLYSQCTQSNVDRAQDKQVWEVFLGDLVPKGAKLTPKLQAEVAHIYTVIDSKDAPHDCNAYLG